MTIVRCKIAEKNTVVQAGIVKKFQHRDCFPGSSAKAGPETKSSYSNDISRFQIFLRKESRATWLFFAKEGLTGPQI